MLDKPTIQDADLIHFLRDQYGLDIADIRFLPIGADSQAAVYHVMTTDKTPYFLKLKRGNFDTMTVQIPHLIRENQISQVIAPQLTQSKQLSAQYKEFHIILYPYVEGQDAYTRHLSPHHWQILGRALRGIHMINIPPDIQSRLRRENFTPYWRDVVTAYLAHIQHEQPKNRLESELATLLHANRHIIADLVHTAHKLGTMLQNQPLGFVLCHGDIHAWNVLIDQQGQLFIVDWDDAILAPKERDLMFIGAGIGGIWDKPEEYTWFFDGYGQVTINDTALAYYRNERIVQDIAVTILDITSDTHSIDNKQLMLQQLAGQFAPDSLLIPIAQKTAQLVK